MPHIPVIDKSKRVDGTFSREDFTFDQERDIYTCPAETLADDCAMSAPIIRCRFIGAGQAPSAACPFKMQMCCLRT